jgi:hypothetical protein
MIFSVLVLYMYSGEHDACDVTLCECISTPGELEKYACPRWRYFSSLPGVNIPSCRVTSEASCLTMFPIWMNSNDFYDSVLAKYSYISSASFSHFNVHNNYWTYHLKCHLSLQPVTNRRNIKMLFSPVFYCFKLPQGFSS